MPNREKVIKGLNYCIHTDGTECPNCPYWPEDDCVEILHADVIALLKDQDAKPLRCKECSYHRNDGWCNELGREVKESDFCSFGAWEGR